MSCSKMQRFTFCNISPGIARIQQMLLIHQLHCWIFLKCAVERLKAKTSQNIRKYLFCIIGHTIWINFNKQTSKHLPIPSDLCRKRHSPTFWLVTISSPNSWSPLPASPSLCSEPRCCFAELSFEIPGVPSPHGPSSGAAPANPLPLADTGIISEYPPVLTSPRKNRHGEHHIKVVQKQNKHWDP